jgi:hypothetical protein
LLPLVLNEVPWGLRQALAQEGLPCVDAARDPLGGRFVLFDSRKGRPELPAGQTAIDVQSLRPSELADPFAALVDESPARHFWQIGPVRLSEETARFDKRALREQPLRRLRTIIEAAGGIWLRVSAWPFPYRSAFNFRFDHDDFVAADFHAALAAAAECAAACTHYVCGSTHERHSDALSALRGADVGTHGYWHHTYHERADNLKNIRRGIEMLQAEGFEPSGFASPHGRYNRGLQSVLEELGITHSSEFGLAYDDLPFYPADSRVLQIPVYPICLGLFLEAVDDPTAGGGLNAEEAAELAADHFQEVAQQKYQTGEPIFFYGHPDRRLGRYPDVLKRLMTTVSGFASLWKTDRTTLCDWWRCRGAVEVQVFRDGEQFVITNQRLPERYRLGVEYWRGEHVAAMPLNRPLVRFSPAALAFQSRKPRQPLTPVRIDPSQGLRGRVRRLIDWERVTPLAEIDRRTWRGWMKRVLRQVKR